MAKKGTNADGWVSGREAAAKALGVTGETLRKWQYENWWKPEYYKKKGRSGAYDVAAIKAANSRYADEATRNETTDLARKLSLQKRITEQKIAQTKLAVLNREHLAVDRIIEIMTRHNKALAHNLTQIPIQLSKLADDAKTKKRLLERGQNIVRQLLRNHADDSHAELQQIIEQ